MLQMPDRLFDLAHKLVALRLFASGYECDGLWYRRPQGWLVEYHPLDGGRTASSRARTFRDLWQRLGALN